MANHLDFRLNKKQQEFCREHIRLAYSEAHRFSRRTGIAYDDLIGAAHIGLCKAAKRFDPLRGFKVSTYAVSLIRGELLHYCRDKSYLLRISHRMRETWMRGRKFIPFGHSDQFIADQLKIPLAEWLEARHVCSGPPVQLNDAVHEITSPGYHGKTQLVEDDRTEAYEDAIKRAWQAMPKKAAALFWTVQGHRCNESERLEALSSIISGASQLLDGEDLTEVDALSLTSASFGGDEPSVEVTFDDEDYGHGRVQLGFRL